MLTNTGHLYLIDFGIARHFKPGQTKDTSALGSAGYAPPEQYGRAQTTTRADIYSLGATMHHLLTGDDPADNPFNFSPLHLPLNPTLVGLDTLIMSMVSVDANQRPASVSHVRMILQRIIMQHQSNQTSQSTLTSLPSQPNPLGRSIPQEYLSPYNRGSNSIGQNGLPTIQPIHPVQPKQAYPLLPASSR
jgi:serine/threonine protein kinase